MTTVSMAIYAYLDSAWTDITSDALSDDSITAEWGIPSSKPFERIANTGQLNFSLKNNGGKYLPSGDNVVSADWKKGTKVKVVFTYDSQDYVRFYGVIDSMQIDAGSQGERKVHVTVLDWLDYASKYPLANPPIQENKTADEALTTIVDSMPIAPLNTDFDIGVNVFPQVFSDTTLETRAYSEFQKLALSELGYVYLTKDQNNGETLVFENADARSLDTTATTIRIPLDEGFLLKEDGDLLLKEDGDYLILEASEDEEIEIDNSMMSMDVSYGDNLINRITTTIYPARVDTTPSLVYKLDKALFIPRGESRVFNVNFTEPNSKKLVATLPTDEDYPVTLMHFDESSAESPIFEESGKYWNFNDCEYVTNVVKFGVSSLYLDGSAPSHAYGTTSDDYEFGDGDFTVEWWEYRFNADANDVVLNREYGVTYPPFLLGLTDGTNSKVYITSNGSSWDIANGKSFGAATIAVWVHYAITREGNTFRMFKDGTITESWTSSASIKASTGTIVIGKYQSNYITACIDELRIVKGQAKYTTNFTAPSEPFSLSGTVFTAYENENRTGVELTGLFSLSINYGTAGAEVTVTNESEDDDGWLTNLSVFAFIVDAQNPIVHVQEDELSIETYGYHEEAIRQIYKQDLEASILNSVNTLDVYKEPRTTINKVTMNANRDVRHMLSFLVSDVGSVVNVSETQTATNAAYHVQSMGWDAYPSNIGVNVNYWWKLKELRRNLYPLVLENSATNGVVTWEYDPNISGDDVKRRVFSAWINTSGDFQNYSSIFSFFDNDERYFTIADIGGGDYRLTFGWIRSTYRPGSTIVPKWRSGTSLTLNTDYHVAVYWDKENYSTAPTFYINGVAVSTEVSQAVSVPADAPLSEVGRNMYTGNKWNGRIGDTRIYNYDFLTTSVSSLVASLYSQGMYGTGNEDGLLHKGTYIEASEYDEKINTTLSYYTNGDTLLDYINRAVGLPTNKIARDDLS